MNGNEMVPSSGLVYEGQVIRPDGELLCLTDMWRAAGSDPKKGPAEWSRWQGSQQFIEFICDQHGISHDGCFRVVRGGTDPGTWAHWQIAMAYAKYLSPAFHAWCNKVVRGYMQGSLAPVGDAFAGLDVRIAEGIQRGMLPIVAPLMERMSQVVDRVDGLDSDVRQLRGKVDDFAPQLAEVYRYIEGKRRKISHRVRAEHVDATAMLGGRCPCCGVVDVVDQWQVLGEFDHFWQNSKADEWHTWLICKGCHADLTTGKAQRHERTQEFNAYQTKRMRLPGRQQALLAA